MLTRRAAMFTDRVVAFFDENPENLTELELLAVAEECVRAFTTRRERLGTVLPPPPPEQRRAIPLTAPCPDCGAGVTYADWDTHTCDPEARERYRARHTEAE